MTVDLAAGGRSRPTDGGARSQERMPRRGSRRPKEPGWTAATQGAGRPPNVAGLREHRLHDDRDVRHDCGMPARTSRAPTLIGVDIGSTSIKAALVAPGSGVLHVARRHHRDSPRYAAAGHTTSQASCSGPWSRPSPSAWPPRRAGIWAARAASASPAWPSPASRSIGETCRSATSSPGTTRGPSARRRRWSGRSERRPSSHGPGCGRSPSTRCPSCSGSASTGRRTSRGCATGPGSRS